MISPRAATALILAALCLLAARDAVAETRPNFILIFTDDLGYGDLGCFGSTHIATPNLDRMAAEGIRLTTYYSGQNVCTPSRAALLTGRYAARMGLAKGVIFQGSKHGLPERELTVAESLRPSGYATACIGKWHLGNHSPFWPTDNGFDYYYGLPYSNDMTPLALYRGSEVIEEPVDQTTLTERYTEEAVKFIEANRDRPFFIYLPHTMPHIPLFVSEKFDGRSKAGLYGDVVETIDWSTGEILKTVERLGLEKTTLVMFTSDNGPWYEGSAGEFRERKGESWEGGQRVPFIAWWPGRIAPGSTSDVMTTALDIFPTLTALGGGDRTGALPTDGVDIAPLLLGRDDADDALARRVFYMFNNEDIAAVRQGRWKYVARTRYITHNVNLNAHSIYKPGLLFDLEADPAESYSVARENPEVMTRMLELYESGVKGIVTEGE